MRTISQEEVTIHCNNYSVVHKVIPLPQAMKIPAAKAAVDKEWEKLEKIPAWNITRVRNKSEVIDGQGDGVPKACRQQAAADSRGSQKLRVCKHPFTSGVWHMQGEEGRINVLPWYRPVGVASTSSESHKEGEPGCPQG